MCLLEIARNGRGGNCLLPESAVIQVKSLNKSYLSGITAPFWTSLSITRLPNIVCAYYAYGKMRLYASPTSSSFSFSISTALSSFMRL